ncbi:hypothetical protein NW764_016513 [Fusarium oxysporum]|nr:hypothetical protein NW764_016513 [Fusarium oxysporum]
MSLPSPRKLWEHPAPETTAMWKFKTSLEQQTVVDESARIDSNPLWFPGVMVNFAQNVLYSGNYNGNPTENGKEDDKLAVTEVREGGDLEPRRQLTWKELRERVAELAGALRSHGVRKGDRIAAVASNSIDTLIALLATTSLGALFSSSSSDMGMKGILDRLLQIRPTYVFFDDWAVYNGKKIDLRQKIRDTINGLQSIGEFRGIISQARFPNQPADVSSIPRCTMWSSFVSAAASRDLIFQDCAFSDPALIAFSSGTTGPPKCIVHAIGGLVLNGHKDSRLHHCIDGESVQLQYTTTGWIMYLQVAWGLMVGAHAIIYDGSPLYPDSRTLIRLVSELQATHLGISPRYLEQLQKEKIVPREMSDLSRLVAVTSTGMALSDALYEWFYDVAFPPNVLLGNISGGTDIAACFASENPIEPLYTGGCQSLSLGMDVQVFSPNGARVQDGVAGELVCVSPFPTMPVSFFGDNGEAKYFKSYFARFKGVWAHGDFIMIHPQTKQVVFLGRSDGVLNPSGIRFGSAEIYNVINSRFSDSVADCICVGQKRPQDSNERVMLFVLMKTGHRFTKALVRDIKQAIRMDLSPRHVPTFVFETPQIPMTVNMKKVELPVKQIVSGQTIKPSGTLLNPESLDYYYQFAEVERLRSQVDPKI